MWLRVRPQNVRECRYEKARRAARRVAYPLAGLRIDQRNNQIDDMPRRSKLPVCPRCRKFRQQVLVHVSFEIMSLVRRKFERMDALHDGPQSWPVVNLQRRAIEQKLSRLGQLRQFVQMLYCVAHRVEQRIPRKRDEISPRIARRFS